MESLFNKLSPITSKVAFIQEDINVIVEKFLEWQNPLISKHHNSFKKAITTTNLETSLMELCPLTTPERRKYLLIPAQNQWVAFFDNGHTGTDRTAPEVLGDKLDAKTVYITFDHNSEETTFEYYSNVNNNFDLVRSIATINEGKWSFHQYGSPLSFEKTENYKARKIKSRFNLNLLIEYLEKLGIYAFNEDFYLCQEGAVLLEKKGPMFDNTKKLSLQQAQNYFS